jgi:tetratricopeptide (TPR) repeat protein
VRTQYLTFLQLLPSAFDKQGIAAAVATSDWLERHPDSINVLGAYLSFLRVVPFTELDNLRQACDKHYQRLIAKNPGDRFGYAQQLNKLKRHEEAIDQCDAVLKKNRFHQMARRERAYALQELGQMSEAEVEFKEALRCARRQKKDEAIFHTSLGEFYLKSERWLEAIESFEQAQKKQPVHYRNHWGIGRAYVGLGDFEKAEDALQRALEDPDLKPPHKDEIVQLLDEVRLRRSS